MAASYVGERYANTQTAQTATTTVTLATNSTAGNTLVIMTRSAASAKIVSSITDATGANTWNVDVALADTGAGSRSGTSIASVFLVNAVTTSTNITITWNNSTSATCDIWVEEVSGLLSSSFLDQTATQVVSAATSISVGPTGTLAQANEIAWAIRGITTNNTNWAHGSGFSDPTTTTLTSGRGAVEYSIVSVNTAITAGGTWTTSGSGTAVLATYKAAAVVTLSINVSDSTTITESVTAQFISLVNKSDTVTLTESVANAIALSINVSDNITLIESIISLIPTYFINVNESANVNESVVVLESGTTLIKTINGLTRGSVKTINGLAVASVKSWNGLQ